MEVAELFAYLLHVDIIIVVTVVMAACPWRVELVTQLLGVFSSKPHAECTLQLDNDPHLPSCVSLAIQCGGWVHKAELGFVVRPGAATVGLTHLWCLGLFKCYSPSFCVCLSKELSSMRYQLSS